MNKSISRTLLLLLVLMCLITGCAKQSPITSISENNDIAKLLSTHSVVSLKMSYFNMPNYADTTYSMTAKMKDGQIEIIDSSQKRRVVYYADHSMHMLEDETSFYTIIMSDFMYITHTASYLEQIDYYADAHYKLVSETNGKQDKVVVYSFEVNDALKEEFLLWGLAKGETIIMTYVLDNDWVILSQKMEIDVKGNDDVLLLTKDFDYNTQFMPDNGLDSYFNSKKTVTVTIIDSTHQDAQPMKYAIPKSTYFGYDFSDTGMDLFYDITCTKLFRHTDGAIEQDITLYLAKANISGQ